MTRALLEFISGVWSRKQAGLPGVAVSLRELMAKTLAPQVLQFQHLFGVELPLGGL